MISLTQYGQWMPADVQTPVSLFLRLIGDNPGILLESAEVDGRLGRYSVLAWDFRLVLTPENGNLAVDVRDERLAPLAKHAGRPFAEGLRAVMRDIRLLPDIDDLPPLTRGLFGYFAYSAGGLLEPGIAEALPPEKAEARLVLPGRVVLFDHTRHRCCFLALDEHARPETKPEPQTEPFAPAPGEPVCTPGREAFKRGVSEARELIAAGEAIQVVLSTQFALPATEPPFGIYRRLRQANPSPFMFFMRFGGEDEALLGASPEMMVRSESGVMSVRPIAGTRPRGDTPEQDADHAEDLLADPKERAEHVMLVDLGRNDVGRTARPGTVRVERFMQVERFSHVMHLTSYVSGELRQDADAVDVLAASFPAGTVSGAPKVRAMQIIADFEGCDRGPYAGCIGWLGTGDEADHCDTGITIRSLWIRDGQVVFRTGAGIVHDSDPEMEWQECHHKARILKEILSRREAVDVFAD